MQRRPLRPAATAVLLTSLAFAGVASTVGAAAPVAALSASVAGQGRLQPSILVEVRGAERGTAQAIADDHGLELRRWLPEIGWAELGYDRAASNSISGVLRADERVLDTDGLGPDESLLPQFMPRDPQFKTSFPGGLSHAWHYIATNFPAAWDLNTGASSTVVGVVDSEFDSEHPELKPKLKTGWNVNSSTAEYHSTDVRAKSNKEYHGSHVAGLIGATPDDAVGIAGAGFDVTILPVRAGLAYETGGLAVDAKALGDVVEGMLWLADKGVAVVNLSLGTSRPHSGLEAAVNTLYGRGITIVASAGNDQLSAPGPRYPAAYDHVIAVGATKPPLGREIAPFSTVGDFVDVVAPGDTIRSTWDTRDVTVSEKGYQTLSGTSMAAPIVSGLVGLIKTARPELTPDEVTSIVTSTASPLGIAEGRTPVYGFGLINAAAAVAAAKAYVRPVAPPAPPPAAPEPVAPAVHRIRVSLKRKGRKVSGKITSTSPQCVANRKVRLTKNKKPLKSAWSVRSGKYSITLPKKTGKYYVVVPESSFPGLLCKVNKSGSTNVTKKVLRKFR